LHPDLCFFSPKTEMQREEKDTRTLLDDVYIIYDQGSINKVQ
jgi:hypothetical protein